MKRLIFLLLFIANLTGVYAQTLTDKWQQQLDSLVNAKGKTFIKDSLRVGLSIGIIQNGLTVMYHFGSTSRKESNLPTNSTLYEIGSITKTFTGVLLAQAVKDKKVKIDDDIRLYLTGSYPNLEYGGQPIRLYHLLNHMSRLPFFLPYNPNLFKSNPDSLPFIIYRIQNHYTREQFFKDLHKVSIDTVPGYKFSYSNAGAQLLGYILESVYKTSYANLVKQYITKPLKMSNTTLTYKTKESKEIAKGYNGKGLLMPYNPLIIGPAGGLYSNIPDMLNYINFHLNENDPVVALSHKTTYGNTNTFAISLNWQINKTNEGYRRIFQSGGSFGFSSYLAVFPEVNIGIILLTNEADQTAQPALGNICQEIFEYLKKNIKK